MIELQRAEFKRLTENKGYLLEDNQRKLMELGAYMVAFEPIRQQEKTHRYYLVLGYTGREMCPLTSNEWNELWYNPFPQSR